MRENLLLIKLNEIDIMNYSFFNVYDINIKIVFSFKEANLLLNSFSPDAILVQLDIIDNTFINKLEDLYIGSNLIIPWVCLVTTNNLTAEKIARSNNVFYYGIGTNEIDKIYTAVKDAIIFGYIAKNEDAYIKNFKGLRDRKEKY